MKFISLLKKEIRELMTFQTVISLVITLVAFYFIGNFMGGVMEDLGKESATVTIVDQDNSEFSKAIITQLEKDGNKVELKTLESDDYKAELKRLGLKNIIIIPKGFENTAFTEKKIANIKYVSTLTTLSMSGNISGAGAQSSIELIKSAVKSTLMLEKFNAEEIAVINDPVKVDNITVVGDKSAQVEASVLSGYASAQGVFVPIVIFILLMYSSQMIISAIATEKIDKTLETLLSAPVSRLSVLGAKMTAAGLVAALNAVVYMIGFSKFMGGITGGATSGGDDSAVQSTIADLGLKLQGMDYVMLGCQMFLTILIALSISLVLGALAKDVKSAQTLVMPIMFMAMIPYMLTMFVDISTLPTIVRTIIYAIPFTHTFIATDNIIFAKDTLFWGGMIYQFIVFVICMFIAVRVFMTDKLFTISLSFGQKKSKGKNKSILQKLIFKK